MSDVIVIGGGVVGSSVAYHLVRENVAVTLVDRADQGQATAAGAGIVSPGVGLGRPEGFHRLMARAAEHYPRLLDQLAEDGEGRAGYDVVGAIFVATNAEEVGDLDSVGQFAEERRAAGVQGIGEISRIDVKDAKGLFPALGDILGGIHISGSARIDGRLIRDAFQRAAAKRGVRVITGNAQPIRAGNRITRVKVGNEVLAAEVVVIAGGVWSLELGEELGINVPLFPQRGQIAHLNMPNEDTSRWPIISTFRRHYLLAFPRNRVVVGATREDESGYDYRQTAGGVYQVLMHALRVAPGLASATLHEVRVGFRPTSPDRLPILGRAPGLQNLYLATGHGSAGLSLGPYSGSVVADLVLGSSVPLDLAPYALDRFQEFPQL